MGVRLERDGGSDGILLPVLIRICIVHCTLLAFAFAWLTDLR